MGFAALFLVLITADSGAWCRVAKDHCDRIELNHVLAADGSESLFQVIFWDFSPTHGYVVRAWRSHKSFSQSPYRVPTSPPGKPIYRAHWHDSRDGNCPREVTANSFVETWTDFDAESVNQEILDRNDRRELTVPVKRKGAK